MHGRGRETCFMFRNAILLIVAILLFALWIAAWLAFKIAGGAVHLVLALAVIVFIAHFLRGRRAV